MYAPKRRRVLAAALSIFTIPYLGCSAAIPPSNENDPMTEEADQRPGSINGVVRLDDATDYGGTRVEYYVRSTGGAADGGSGRTLLDVTNTADDGSFNIVGSSRVDLQACKLEYSIVSPK